MMDFARRLAPAAAADATRAVAVLPSRFGGASPVRQDAAASPLDAAAVPVATTSQRPSRSVDPSTSHVATMHTHEPRGEATPSTPPARDADLSSPAATPSHRGADSAAATLRSLLSDMPGHSARVSPSPAVRSARDHAASGEDAATGAMRLTTASPAFTSAQTAPRQPLSEAALAARNTQAASAPRPIVHVTIDRIEVRAPATPSKPAPAPPPRAAAPSVSLGDYLRQRTPQRGGLT